jgi:hypothetical protein
LPTVERALFSKPLFLFMGENIRKIGNELEIDEETVGRGLKNDS